MAKKNFNKMAEEIVAKVGGAENVNILTHCVTRLRFKLKDETLAKTDEIKEIDGVLSVIQAAGQYQVVIGNDVVNVFDKIISNYKISAGEALKVNEGDVTESKPTGFKGAWAAFLDYITGTMTQLLPILIGAGLLSVILAIATSLFKVSTESQTYQVFNFVYNAGFYFLPIYVGIAAAKKLNSNQYMAAFMGAVLVHPTLTAMVAEGNTQLFGLNFTGISYSSTVIPMLLITFVMSYVEKYAYKLLPSAIKSTFAPLITMLIMVPLALFILGPAGYTVGSGIVNAFLWVYETVPFLVVPLSAVLWPILVMVGAHTLLVPTMTELLSTAGFDAVIKPGAYCSNFAILGVVLAVAFKSKKMRSVAITAATSTAFGISEPSLYGVIIPMKKTLIAMIGGSAAGGIVAAIFGVKAYFFAANSILSILMFGDTMIAELIAIVVSVATAFVLTLVLGFDDGEKSVVSK